LEATDERVPARPRAWNTRAEHIEKKKTNTMHAARTRKVVEGGLRTLTPSAETCISSRGETQKSKKGMSENQEICSSPTGGDDLPGW